jgi:zinc transport system permease protein
MFEYDFTRNALFAVLLITPILGLLGTMVVNNKMAFFSDALGHSVLAGIGIGVVLGIVDVLWVTIIFSVLFALLVVLIRGISNSSNDTIIGVLSSTGIALGIVLLSRNGNFSKYTIYLTGDILSITHSELLVLLITLIIVIILWVLIFNRLLLLSLNKTFAISRNVDTFPIEIIFTVVIAIIVALSIKWVGVLIISSFLVIPAAASRNISKGMRMYTITAVIIAVVSGVAGLITAFYLNTSTGATIVLYCASFYLVTLVISRVIRR